MEIVESVEINTSARALFAIYSEVARWPEWDPDTRAAAIDGPFASGTVGRLTPAKGFPVPMLLTGVVPDRAFTVESRVLFSRMVFTHVLEPVPGGVRASHGVAFHGPFAPFLRRLVGSRVRRGLPLTMLSLKAYAEAAGRADAAGGVRRADGPAPAP